MKLIARLSLVLLLLPLLITGCGLLQEVEAPSGEIEAVPLATTAPADEPAAADAPAEEPAAADAPADAPAGGATLLEIVPADSTVRFELDELLRGNPVTVVGTTDQVAGQISLNLADLSQTQIGEIRINARTLATDNEFRNRAINNEILDTGDFEFITFAPTSIDGLPASAAVGDEINFTVSGDLTIRDMTNVVTFEMTATVVSPTEIRGTAGAVVQRADFDLRIPEVPSVANVEEEVELTIDFVARAS